MQTDRFYQRAGTLGLRLPLKQKTRKQKNEFENEFERNFETKGQYVHKG